MWFNKPTEKWDLIHNRRLPQPQRDFSLNAAGLAVLALLVAFVLASLFLAGKRPGPLELAILLGAPMAAILLMSLLPRWAAAVKLLLLAGLALGVWGGELGGLALALGAGGLLFAPAVQRLEEWERAIVLRFGKFHRVRGPGLFLLLPLADRVAQVVDLRIRVTDFSAETTLTRDSVTVTVDALCFWLVWDAEKAICEVENYEEAVVLSAKTALRSAVSRNDLSVFLERGAEIEAHIKEDVDAKTTDWGITVQHIEITDIQIPEGLQDSMSRLAQAEREKRGRILLAEAELEIAKRFEEAARIYDKNESAMKLKSLSILYEGLKAGNSMMLVPNSITEELKSKDLFGLQALTETRTHAKETRDEDRGEGKEDGHDRR